MPTRIHWEGSFFANHSLALVNREIVARLAPRPELRVTLDSREPRTELSWDAERIARLRALEIPGGEGPDVWVRHRWPLEPKPPRAGKWVVFQPWEFGPIPRDWLEPMRFGADEVWVYSSFNKRCYVESGISEERIRVVPLGVHEAMLGAPAAESFPLRTRKRFRFLFVGGTILRKGIDLLIDAYIREFSPEDDVCLVVKDFGVGSFYRNQTYDRFIRELQRQPGAPEIEYLVDELTAERLRDLYHACDCLVHPYRGEGFGLPIAEAMACGLPVLVPEEGGASDFCTSETAVLLPARRVSIPVTYARGLDAVAKPWWMEVEVDALRVRMREMYEHPERFAAVAERGSAAIRERFTWDAAAEHAARGAEELHGRGGMPLRADAAEQYRLRSEAGSRCGERGDREGAVGHFSLAPERREDVLFRTARMSTAPIAPRRARWNGRKGPATLGVVMIVRNEAENLPHLFETIADVADEVVVVDTGSTDATVAVCGAWGVRVVHEKWRNDFSHARNRSIAAATAKHLLWLDGDDRLPAETRRRLCWLRDTVLPKKREQAFLMEVQSLNAAGEAFDLCVQLRIFPRLPGIRFKHAIHEEVASSLRAARVETTRLDAVVQHLGYSDPELVREKAKRNEALLHAELEKDPTNFHARIHLAQGMAVLGDAVEAEREMSGVIARVQEARISDPFAAELHFMRNLYRQRIGNRPGAFYDLQRAAELRPEWGLPCAALAELYFAQNDREASWRMVEKARAASFESTIMGLPIRHARRNLEVCAGRLLLERGESDEGIACLLRALELAPSALAIRLEAGQALLDAGRFAEAKEVLEPAGEDEANTGWVVEICAGVALARLMTGDEAGAAACLSPLLTVFATQLGGADDVGPLELAEAMLLAGHAIAAKNLMALYQHTTLAAR